MKLINSPTLRQALHGIYVALFSAHKNCPEEFQGSRLTNMYTAMVGLENYGWRVVGITREALDLLATVDFQKNKLPRKLCRGHITNRSETARTLFERTEPMELDSFFRVFLHNDRTVIMLNEQNSHGRSFPNYIPIDNPCAALFPNGSLMSWKHRKLESDYLRNLHSQLATSS